MPSPAHHMTFALAPMSDAPTPMADPAGWPARARAEDTLGRLPAFGHGPNRATLLALQRFVRAAEDIADDHRLDSVARLARLESLDAILSGKESGGPGRDARGATGPAPAAAFELRAQLTRAGLPLDPPRHFLQAMRADAANRPCRSWSDLLAYCRYAAAPIAQLLIAAHGERAEARPAAEAAAAALQVLVTIRDAKLDYLALRRVYLPADWLAAAGATVADLAQPACSPPLRAAIDRVLDGIDQLRAAAAPLPGQLASRRLQLETAVALRLISRLAQRLRREDPIAAPVRLTHCDRLSARLGARWALFWR